MADPAASLPPALAAALGVPSLNRLQRRCLPHALHSSANLVVAAPTASGKTLLFELAIYRALCGAQQGPRKAVYLAPIKALCQEKHRDWSRRLAALGIVCRELTGDTDPALESAILHDADLILTTPEKWDALSRRCQDLDRVIRSVALLCIDEVHMVADTRGSTLEAIVSRMRALQRIAAPPDPVAALRIVAMSASIPDVGDFGEWLGAPAGFAILCGREYRASRLDIKIVAYPNNSRNLFMYDRSLNYRILEVVLAHNARRPSIVFCSSRNGAVRACTFVRDEIQRSGVYRNSLLRDDSHIQHLWTESRKASDATLQDCITMGLAFHHAGLALPDRELVEALFRAELVMLLFATTTLALGVNLPAHLVVIKGTQQYRQGAGGYQEYPESCIQQMVGRAGRPGFDDCGVAVILTRPETRHLYDAVQAGGAGAGAAPVESSLLDRLPEHLNAEVNSSVAITDISMAIQWVRSTFLYVRVRKNPAAYGLPRGASPSQVTQFLRDSCVASLRELAQHGMVGFGDDGFTVGPADPGRVMANSCIAFATMKRFVAIPADAGVAGILAALAASDEFSFVQLRRDEKRLLNALNKAVLYPAADGKIIKTAAHKISILVQAVLSNLSLDDHARAASSTTSTWVLKQEASQVLKIGSRLLRGLGLLLRLGKTHFSNTLAALRLEVAFKRGLWVHGPEALVCRQIDRIGPSLAKTLADARIDTIQSLAAAEPRRVEHVLGRHPPFGSEVVASAQAIPWYAVTAAVDPVARSVTVTLLPGNRRPAVRPCWFVVVVGLPATDALLSSRNIKLPGGTTTFRVPLPDAPRAVPDVSVFVQNSEYCGLDAVAKVTQAAPPAGCGGGGGGGGGAVASATATFAAPVPKAKAKPKPKRDLDSFRHDVEQAATKARTDVPHATVRRLPLPAPALVPTTPVGGQAVRRPPPVAPAPAPLPTPTPTPTPTPVLDADLLALAEQHPELFGPVSAPPLPRAHPKPLHQTALFRFFSRPEP